jgi:hypothetical protein
MLYCHLTHAANIHPRHKADFTLMAGEGQDEIPREAGS